MTRFRLPAGARQAAVLLAGALLLGLSLAPAARAQDKLEDASFAVSLELNGGAAFYGHFLEQRAILPTGGVGERELTAETGASLGAALGVRLFERNVVRLSLDYLPGSFAYREDTGDGSTALDEDDLGEFNLFALSVEAERTFFRVGRFAPYASVGLSGGLWNLGEGGTVTDEGASEALFRWGGTSGGGVRIEFTPDLFLNLEVNALSLGNPFDGNEAFRVSGDDRQATLDEPVSVTALRVRGGLRYIF